ncbi:peptidoglycan DD-metalloendopeptidase family protein [Vibrio sp. ZSDE26]|uniref:Peptidoglycan DD-metalloendopeptidase family protein n=1 Tax=Vibrio amylolyticus TaxID=2847292 RepID=A0A9X2BH36_9VIBR|nr:peptidoglycan DD-metalloendopeptidase family protein [Vibrio amylolyticus]MCK6263541.1 peptidoglycan DD-metalloendopeptidase family protein [Vibrio amylolyticus]
MNSISRISPSNKLRVPFVIFSIILIIGIVGLISIEFNKKTSIYNQDNLWRKSNNDFHLSYPSELNQSNIIKREHYSGEVKYSFISSIMDSGLPSNVAHQLINVTLGKLDHFDQRNDNATFLVQTKSNSYDNKSRLEAFLYKTSSYSFYIFNSETNELFNQHGRSLVKNEFLVNPTQDHFRISSQFSHNRLHPITQRYSPHNGTDYATPIGSKIVSVGNGEVVSSRFNRLAGNYIVIKHSDSKVSRYLHLSESFVSKGGYVTSGEVIGLSGNSGRTTGPHLHFELIVDGRPINFEEYINNQERYEEFANDYSDEAVQTYHDLKQALL